MFTITGSDPTSYSFTIFHKDKCGQGRNLHCSLRLLVLKSVKELYIKKTMGCWEKCGAYRTIIGVDFEEMNIGEFISQSLECRCNGSAWCAPWGRKG